MSPKASFLDQAKIFIKAGNGGDGVATFHRAKYIPNGGPDGGDGGHGGSIYLRASVHKSSLQDFRKKRHYKAQNGKPGRSSQKTGASGEDIIIDVPLGTIACISETGEVLGELTKEGQTLLLQKGGKGGLGNIHFKSSTNQAPKKCYPGEITEEVWIQLELKIISDIGIIGLPNAGKSTFLSTITKAKSKSGDYPFTTLHPFLGVLELPNQKITLADIPGIIQGAHEGQGLGLHFLRHVHRAKALLFFLEGNNEAPESCLKAYNILREEIREYDSAILQKKYLIAITKCDTLSAESIQRIENDFQDNDMKVFFISSIENIGIKDLLDALPSIV